MNKKLVTRATINQPGFYFPRKIRVIVNCLQTGHGRYNHLINMIWKLYAIPACDCDYESRKIFPIVTEFLYRAFEDTLSDTHAANGDAVKWIQNLDINLYVPYYYISYNSYLVNILLVLNVSTISLSCFILHFYI